MRTAEIDGTSIISAAGLVIEEARRHRARRRRLRAIAVIAVLLLLGTLVGVYAADHASTAITIHQPARTAMGGQSQVEGSAMAGGGLHSGPIARGWVVARPVTAHNWKVVAVVHDGTWRASLRPGDYTLRIRPAFQTVHYPKILPATHLHVGLSALHGVSLLYDPQAP